MRFRILHHHTSLQKTGHVHLNHSHQLPWNASKNWFSHTSTTWPKTLLIALSLPTWGGQSIPLHHALQHLESSRIYAIRFISWFVQFCCGRCEVKIFIWSLLEVGMAKCFFSFRIFFGVILLNFANMPPSGTYQWPLVFALLVCEYWLLPHSYCSLYRSVKKVSGTKYQARLFWICFYFLMT